MLSVTTNVMCLFCNIVVVITVCHQNNVACVVLLLKDVVMKSRDGQFKSKGRTRRHFNDFFLLTYQLYSMGT